LGTKLPFESLTDLVVASIRESGQWKQYSLTILHYQGMEFIGMHVAEQHQESFAATC